ncbi:Transcription antitermination protein NusB [Candidatus Erwinia haradaeae]|uniref:Transcription antitermination protein NusB n=1 Tax=Candidatus Erwinia haradaeae TaxID=1922217 RepID=A0A451CZH8_9GAMM|nr:transcription antitermination factor NusB [Candidatus Erwinia haradaeae]VFP78558.1 Transcription antitermination protein NusB [Candidatus Erwinia haradaeae]
MNPSSRRRARECAVQALYAWQVSNNNMSEIEYQILEENNIKDIDIIYFRELINGIVMYNVQLDKLIEPHLSRDLADLGLVEKAILRIALFELHKRSDVPYKVAINEGIELAKVFGAQDSHKFINGVLDKVSLQIRESFI